MSPPEMTAKERKQNREALDAADKALDQLLNGGFRGEGVIPPHYARTRATTEAALSLVRLAIRIDDDATRRGAP